MLELPIDRLEYVKQDSSTTITRVPRKDFHLSSVFRAVWKLRLSRMVTLRRQR